MYKKFTIAAIMIILGSMIFSPAVLSSETNTADANGGFEIKALLASSSFLHITYDAEAVSSLVVPDGDPIEIPINITYQISGIISGLHSKLYKNRDVKIKLNITEKPYWCVASLSEYNLSTTPGKQDNLTSILSISVNKTAEAYAVGSISIEATSSSIKGLLGIVTKVTGASADFDVLFKVDYLPLIEVEIGNYSSEVPPLNFTTIPVNITNLGNGQTIVSIEVENESGNYSVNYLETILLNTPFSGEGNKKQINIRIKPYKNFSKETIKINFTPAYYRDPKIAGETIVKSITLENDGSLKEELELNSTLLIVVIVVIILVLIFAIILKKRK